MLALSIIGRNATRVETERSAEERVFLKNVLFLIVRGVDVR